MIQAARAIPVLLLLCSAGAVLAEQRGADVRTRDVYVSVVDNRGAPVTGMTAADFVVREDNVAREVLSAKTADTPLQIALLVDDSAAASDATTFIREGLAAFFERMRGKGEISLMTIGERPTVAVPFTPDTQLLNDRAKRIFPRTNAGAYLLEAIIDASKELAKREAVRPVILALTFEGIEHSNQQHDQVLKELEKSGAALHVIAVGSPRGSLSDEERSRGMVIAEGTRRTGGRRDQVLADSGIPERLKQAADELINQYVVSYGRPDKLVPPEKLSVTSTRPNVTVRARARAAR